MELSVDRLRCSRLCDRVSHRLVSQGLYPRNLFTASTRKYTNSATKKISRMVSNISCLKQNVRPHEDQERPIPQRTATVHSMRSRRVTSATDWMHSSVFRPHSELWHAPRSPQT